MNCDWSVVGAYYGNTDRRILLLCFNTPYWQQHRTIQLNNTSSKNAKRKNSKKRHRTNSIHGTLFYCAGECAPDSLLYCFPADINRRQTIQTSNCHRTYKAQRHLHMPLIQQSYIIIVTIIMCKFLVRLLQTCT